MASFKNVVERIIHIDKVDNAYKNQLVDSPLKLGYTLSKHSEIETKYFLTLDWNYKHQNSETGEIYFTLAVTTAYEIDFEEENTSFDNIYTIFLDGHKRLKTIHDKEIANTCFSKLEITDPEEHIFDRKVKKIVYEDLPEANLK